MKLTDQNLAVRRGRVGASEAAILMPCGVPWATKSDLYVRLVHGIEREAGRAASMGSALESVIFDLGKAKAEVPSARRNSHTYLWGEHLAATPDGLARNSVVETKNVSHWAWETHWQYGAAIPEHYMVQLQTQMLATGRQFAHLWALVEGQHVETWLVEADPFMQTDIENSVWQFFARHVTPRIPPEDLEPEWVLTVTAPEGTVVADGELLSLGETLDWRLHEEDERERDTEQVRDDFTREMAARGAAVVVGPGWSARTQSTATGKRYLKFSKSK